MTRLMRVVLGTWCAIGLLVLYPSQGRARQTPEKVRIALIDELITPSARAEVVRYGDGAAALVLLRRDDAKPEVLMAALAALGASSKRHETARNTMRHLVIEGLALDQRGNDALLRRFEQALSVVRAQPRARIGNRGTGQWAEFNGLK